MSIVPYCVVFALVFTIKNMIMMKAPTKFSDKDYFKRSSAIIGRTIGEMVFAMVAIGITLGLGRVIAKMLGV